MQFTLKSGFGATTEVKITNFKFYGVKTTGSYDASQESPAWTLTATANTKDDTNFKSDAEETAQYKADATKDVINSWVIIPQKNTDSDKVEMVKFTVNVVDGESKAPIGTKDFTAKIPSITWEKGYRYNYIFTITPEQMGVADQYITFDAPKVTEWDDDTNLTIDEDNSSTSGVEFVE